MHSISNITRTSITTLHAAIRSDLEAGRPFVVDILANLMMNGIIDQKRIVDITRNLVCQLYKFISEDNKKNEVDELTENIAILYKPTLYNIEYELVEGMTICQIVVKLSGCKVKDYKSLTNKTIFKFMDLVDM